MFFIYEYDGMEIEVNYTAKDFTAIHKSKFGNLQYSLHIMAMNPKEYTEDILRTKYCSDIAKDFEAVLKMLEKNPGYINNAKSALEHELTPHMQELDSIRAQKKLAKEQLGQGQIIQSQYQSICKQLYDKELHIQQVKYDFYTNTQEKAGIDLTAIRDLLI